MARYKLLILLILPALLMVGLAQSAAQVAPTPAPGDLFTPVRTIGQSRPSGLRYDPNFDRFAWVDAAGQLVVVDAATLVPLHVLYTSGSYSAFTFSRSGQLLAVAIDVQVDVWDVASGVRVASFAPTGALRIQGPLQFTRSDELLLFDSIVPASQDLRRSENDTMLLPWLWDIAAAREQRPSVLVNRVIAYPFYNVRVSMVAGDNGILVSGLDNRIQVYDADTPTLQMIADLPANRLETDPIVAYRSATDPLLYVSLQGSRTVQINTLTDTVLPFDLGVDLSVPGLDALRQRATSRATQRIGDNSNQFNPLEGLILGSDYLKSAGYQGMMFDLFDVLIPMLDDPGHDPASNVGLMTFAFYEQPGYGYGVIDALRPPFVNQIALSPDTKTLAFRRQSGEVALYDIPSGALLHVFTPSEPDPDGQHTFAFTGDGKTLVVDFERFDAQTGALQSRQPDFTQPFDGYAFDSDDHLITFGGSPLKNATANAQTWRLWDVQTGLLLREDNFTLSGDLMAETNDQLRYLTQTLRDDGSADLLIIDGRADSSQTIHIPALDGASISNIVPSDDWTRFLVVYSSGALAAYTRDGARLYFDAGNNLPAGVYRYGWRDNRTITVQAGGPMPAAPITGIDYTPSGLPRCVVDSLPGTWTALIPVWERLVMNNSPERINDFARQLCTALTGAGATNVAAAEGTPTLPANVTAVVGMLTSSPAFSYQSARTPAPIAVPGVPTCITSRFRSQSAAYADLWRQVTAGVTDPAKLADIDKMICEGLMSDLGYLQPTPTVNPNGLAVTTPTPLPAGPQTTGGDENAFNVLTIDVETGARSFAANLVPTPQPPQPDTTALLNTYFRSQYKAYPNHPVVSPDGRYMAAQEADGFVTLYQLVRPLPDLLADEQNAIATRAAGAPRSIGLAPTATLPPQALGTPMPTLTPTMTLTPIPLTDAQANLPQWGQTQAVCPARKLARLPNLPAGFAPPGSLIVDPVSENVDRSFLWTLNPRSGKLTGDVDRPQCGTKESCDLSPDGKWMVRQTDAVVVSRPDGSDAVTLYSATDVGVINPSFTWREPHTLIINYSGILPTLSPNAQPLIATYDPETRVRTAGALQPTPVPLGLLPFEVVSTQPYGTLELLREHFPGGARFYLRDTATQQASLFAQDLDGWGWQPAGRFLYYAKGEYTYQYDTLTQQHMVIGKGAIPYAIWSPDGHLLANWTGISGDDIGKALMQGDLPPRLEIWNSDTGLMYTYCLPELSQIALDGTALFWSPDSRYLAFTVSGLLPDGDVAPTPTFAISPEAPPATNTPIPLETQYEYRNPRTIILDTATGNAAIVGDEASTIERWEVTP